MNLGVHFALQLSAVFGRRVHDAVCFRKQVPERSLGLGIAPFRKVVRVLSSVVLGCDWLKLPRGLQMLARSGGGSHLAPDLARSEAAVVATCSSSRCAPVCPTTQKKVSTKMSV